MNVFFRVQAEKAAGTYVPPSQPAPAAPDLVLNQEAEMALRRVHGFVLGVVEDARIEHGLKLIDVRRDLAIIDAALKEQTP